MAKQVQFVGDAAGGTPKGQPSTGKGKAGPSGMPGKTDSLGRERVAPTGSGPRVNMPGKKAKPTSVRRIGTK